MQPEQQSEVEATHFRAEEPSDEPQEVVDGPARLPEVEPIHWQAVEYVQQSKTPIWYILFGVIVIAMMAVAILLMQAWTFALLIPVMACALMVYIHRPAHSVPYTLSEKGLYINDQLHPLEEFKAFGVITASPLNSLILIPIKRFKPSLTVYFPTEVGEQIVDLLGGYIPMQEVKPDAFDTIVHKLHI